MELDSTIFKPEQVETFERELLDRARMVIDTDRLETLEYLFQFLQGYADHLSAGMVSAGFPEAEALCQGWQTAWTKLRSILDTETNHTLEVAAYLERNLGNVNPNTSTSDNGEPLDHATRAFYRTFIDAVEHPAIHMTAAWLYEND